MDTTPFYESLRQFTLPLEGIHIVRWENSGVMTKLAIGEMPLRTAPIHSTGELYWILCNSFSQFALGTSFDAVVENGYLLLTVYRNKSGSFTKDDIHAEQWRKDHAIYQRFTSDATGYSAYIDSANNALCANLRDRHMNSRGKCWIANDLFAPRWLPPKSRYNRANQLEDIHPDAILVAPARHQYEIVFGKGPQLLVKLDHRPVAMLVRGKGYNVFSVNDNDVALRWDEQLYQKYFGTGG